ncbi:hypothetical protein R3P38DRAFT_2527114 [Favolaschia claudopus]|uniref:BTB domain-containing protein n=1 Tax=Favolaschia claudopus TaxID=2862362 RepID=A0AAW0BL92_9AGAR
MGRHPSLYFADGTLTLQAGDGSDIIYNVYREPLMHHSPLFKGMLSLPHAELPSLSPAATNVRELLAKARETGLEGLKDETAVVLPAQLKSAELDEFILFLFLHAYVLCSGEFPPSVERACAILKVSHFFAVDCGITFARTHLDNNSDFGPCHRFRLGFDYQIREWIIDAFDQLMGVPIGELSPEDEMLLGPRGYRAVARAQSRCLDSRLRLAVRAEEPNHSNECLNHYSCKEEWTKMWTSTRGVLGDIIVHDFPGSRIIERLHGYPVGHMGPDCHRRTCDGLLGTADKPSIFLKEEELIDEEIYTLMKEEGVV